jgi:hypothetical protein
MAAALVPLQNITLSTATASVTFGSIPATMRDLVLICHGRSNRSATTDIYKMLINGSTTGYSRVVAYGTGSSASSYSDASLSDLRPYALTGASATSGVYGFVKTQIMDYSATDKHKTILNNEDATGAELSMSAYRWANTAAVTSISIAPLLGTTLSAGSTFALYGVVA